MALAEALAELDALPVLLEGLRLRFNDESSAVWQRALVAYPQAKRFCEEKVIAEEEGKQLFNSDSRELCFLKFLEQSQKTSLQELFYESIKRKSVVIVEYLLPFIDPSADSNLSLKIAATTRSMNGSPADLRIVDLLISALNAMGKLDAETCYYCSEKAIKYGYTDIVSRFLQEPFIDITSRQSCELYCTALFYKNRYIANKLASQGIRACLY